MTLQIQAETRDVFGKKNKALRRIGYIPAVIYGHHFKNIPLKVKTSDFLGVLKEAGETTIIQLRIGKDKTESVIVHNLERDPVTDQILHIDFYRVKTGEKMVADIPLVLEGKAPAVEDLGGILVTGLKTIKIKALPKDLPHGIKVDVSLLKDFEAKIQVQDLVLPSGIEVLSGPEEIVASVSEPRIEKELETLETEEKEEAEAEQIENIKEEKETEEKTEEEKEEN